MLKALKGIWGIIQQIYAECKQKSIMNQSVRLPISLPLNSAFSLIGCETYTVILNPHCIGEVMKITDFPWDSGFTGLE